MPPGKRIRYPRRWLPELAAVLWAIFFVVTLLIALPALGVIPTSLPFAVLRLVRDAALLVVILAVVSLASIACDELLLAVKRWRIRRRRNRAGGWL
jgi:fumarate reductase subunit C